MRLSAILCWVACIAVGAGLSACADTAVLPPPQHLTAPEEEDGQKTIADPNEAFNRTIFENNQKFNHAVLYPVAKAYNDAVPESVRGRVEAFTTNLGEPMVFANDVLQLRFKGAATTFGRFALNSTIGLGGLFDIAVSEGLAKQSGDFGQTMYVWGYRDSAYLMLPIVGPTNVRDAIGSGVEFAAQLNSGALIPTRLASTKNVADFIEDIDPVTDTVDVAGTVAGPLANLSKAGDMQDLEESSIDFYSMLRSVTDQKRQAELQEALETSAFTSTPLTPASKTIEPATEIVSSTSMQESGNTTDVAMSRSASSKANGSVVIVGAPVPASGN